MGFTLVTSPGQELRDKNTPPRVDETTGNRETYRVLWILSQEVYHL